EDARPPTVGRHEGAGGAGGGWVGAVERGRGGAHAVAPHGRGTGTAASASAHRACQPVSAASACRTSSWDAGGSFRAVRTTKTKAALARLCSSRSGPTAPAKSPPAPSRAGQVVSGGGGGSVQS